MISKSKPLLNNANQNSRIPLSNNSQNIAYAPQDRLNIDMRGQFMQPNLQPNMQQNNGWKNVKSPKSPQIDNQNNFNLNNGMKNCYNHLNKKAEYMTETDGEVIYYCETCAAKLAAQRFEVIRLPSSR